MPNTTEQVHLVQVTHDEVDLLLILLLALSANNGIEMIQAMVQARTMASENEDAYGAVVDKIIAVHVQMMAEGACR